MKWLPLVARVFVFCGLWGALFGLITGDAGTAIYYGVFFGLWMVAVLVGMTAYKLRGRPDIELSHRQRADLATVVPVAELHARAVAALGTMPAWITAETFERIEARSRMSWSSWGEVIVVELRPGTGATLATVRVSPRVPFGLVSDYRRSRGFVDHLAWALTAPEAVQPPQVSSLPNPGPAPS